LLSLGLAGIFLTVAIENIGVPFPIEASYIAACLLIQQKGYSYFLLLFILTTGHLSGSTAALGYRSEAFFLRLWKNKPKFTAIHDLVHRWYSRYGALTVFLTRFVGYVRPWSSFVAGFARIGWKTFVLWTFLGSLLFNIILLEFTARFLHIWFRYDHHRITFCAISSSRSACCSCSRTSGGD
jgi:membrane protein DedA with SNARE-associated domain